MFSILKTPLHSCQSRFENVLVQSCFVFICTSMIGCVDKLLELCLIGFIELDMKMMNDKIVINDYSIYGYILRI